VTHNGQVYPGEHEAIISREVWDKVHSILDRNHRGRAALTRAKTPAMLKGLIRCGHCDTTMAVTFTRKKGRMYRYYLCLHASKNGHDACPVKSVAAGEIEKAVIRQLRAVFRTPEVVARTLRSARRREADEMERLRREKRELADTVETATVASDDARERLQAVTSRLGAMGAHPLTQQEVIDSLRNLEPVWDELFPGEQARIVELLVREVVVRADGLDLYLRTNGLRSLVAEIGESDGDAPCQTSRMDPAVDGGDSLLIRVPLRFKRRGGRKEIFAPDAAQDDDMSATPAQEPLVNALGLAHRWQKMLDSGEAATAEEIAKATGLSKAYVTRMLRLNTLAPDIVEAILDGREPSGLSLGRLSRPLPLLWKEQREQLGFAAPLSAVAATA
jgi:site-specific DNA recombinase